MAAEHKNEIEAWKTTNNKNRKLAENLLSQQDAEITAKNDIIQSLNKELAELTGNG